MVNPTGEQVKPPARMPVLPTLAVYSRTLEDYPDPDTDLWEPDPLLAWLYIPMLEKHFAGLWWAHWICDHCEQHHRARWPERKGL